jgi:sugar lactone lactonase YvrE
MIRALRGIVVGRNCRWAAPALCAVLALLATSCSQPLQKLTPVFFPPAPDPPRIQFLTFFTGRKDIERQSSFNKFVAGEAEDVKLDKPYGLAIHDGKIYVCDTNTTVIVFDLKARTFGPLKGAVGPGRLIQPQNISVASDGTKYVADPGRGQVVVFGRNDEYVKAYGEPATWRPVDMAPFEGRLYVVDTKDNLVQVLNAETGEPVKRIGGDDDPEKRLYRPTNVSIDAEGHIFVTDVGRFQVVGYDRDGHLLSAAGKLGDNLGHFARPKGTAVDRAGRLWTVDAAFNVVQVFNPQGRLLLFFGAEGNRPGGLVLPAKVVIDYDHLRWFQQYVQPGFQAEFLILVTSQFGDRRVNVFAYGQEKGRKYPTDLESARQIDERRRQEIEKAKKVPVPSPSPAPEQPPSPEPHP